MPRAEKKGKSPFLTTYLPRFSALEKDEKVGEIKAFLLLVSFSWGLHCQLHKRGGPIQNTTTRNQNWDALILLLPRPPLLLLSLLFSSKHKENQILR